MGLLVVAAGAYFAVTRLRKPKPAADVTVQAEISTTPPGATVTVAGGGSQTCTSNCKLPLTPGAYQVSASLEGYDSAVSAVTVTAGQPAAVSLTLQPQAQSLRLLTDLDKGTVTVDDRPPADLQEGQLVLDKVAPGTHTVKVAGPKGDASFSFQVADARLPAKGERQDDASVQQTLDVCAIVPILFSWPARSAFATTRSWLSASPVAIARGSGATGSQRWRSALVPTR